MSKTNQVCICCEARDTCPHYDTRRTECVPVKCTDWEDFSTIQDTTDWQHYRIQAAIAAMQGQLSNDKTIQIINDLSQVIDDHDAYMRIIAASSVRLADALIEELKKGGEQ